MKFALLFLLALAACSDPASPESQIDEAADRWAERGPTNYQYQYWQVCECLPTGRWIVAVREGEVVAAEVAPGENPQPTTPPLDQFYTVEGLFDRLRTSAASNPFRFDVEFDGSLGYPRDADIDVSQQTVDDEYRLEVRDLVAE